MGNLNEFFRDLGRNAYGLGENVASLGSAAIAEPVAGFAAMYDPANGAQAIREGMTYTPRTQAGQMYQQGAARTLGAIAKPAMPVIETWQRGVDIAGGYSPVAGAMLRTVPAAIGVAMGAKPALQAGRQVSNSLGAMQARMIANANAPRTLNTGFMGQRGAVGTQRPLTEFEQAYLTAQRNAALPVNQGGLGLPANNTAMDRARALGFDVDNPVYHGTGADFTEFKPSASGTFFSRQKNIADQFGDAKQYYIKGDNKFKINTGSLTKEQRDFFDKIEPDIFDENDIEAMGGDYSGLSDAMAYGDLYRVAGRKAQNNVLKKINKKGFDLAEIPDWHGDASDSVSILFNNANVRLPTAAFDPMQRQSSNLLAQSAKLAPAATLGALMANEKRKDKRN
jgi:hypothetical protein